MTTCKCPACHAPFERGVGITLFDTKRPSPPYMLRTEICMQCARVMNNAPVAVYKRVLEAIRQTFRPGALRRKSVKPRQPTIENREGVLK